jgi:hypothetical protein
MSPRDGSFVCTTPSIRIQVLSNNNLWIRSFSCLLCVSYSNSSPKTSVVSLLLILHKKNSNLVFLITRHGHPLAAQSRGTRDLSERSRISRNKGFAVIMTQAIKKKFTPVSSRAHSPSHTRSVFSTPKVTKSILSSPLPSIPYSVP